MKSIGFCASGDSDGMGRGSEDPGYISYVFTKFHLKGSLVGIMNDKLLVYADR